ncbi:MAG: transglycosylase SLT domain-containing protein [Pseudomonadota bacterium]
MLLGGWPSAGQDIDGERLAEVRGAFVRAFELERQGLPAEGEPEELRAYPLYPYLQAARLERALGGVEPGASDARVEAFLTEFGQEPVGLALRRAWLESLGKRERWQALLEHFDSRTATQALECQRFRARIALGEVAGLAAEIVATWLTPRQLPSVCEAPFQWLRDQDLLDDALVERRVRGLLAHGRAEFAKVIARRLPAESAQPLLVWADLIQNPAPTIDAFAEAPDRRFDTAALLDGFAQLARDGPDAAVDRIDTIAALVEHDRVSLRTARLSLAFGLAWDRDSRALDFFPFAGPALDDYAREWLARAALWNDDWPLVEAAIAGMSATQRAESAWRYWAARAAEAVGDPTRACALYESLLPDDNYYSVMAAARLGIRFAPHPQSLEYEANVLADLAQRPGLIRARELQLAGLHSRAVLEWRHVGKLFSAREQRQSIHLAARWQLYDIAVATATRVQVFYDYALLYPRPFREQVREAAALTDIDRHLIFGLLRQESLFRPDAVSTTDALGLAQLRAGTATIAAHRWDLPRPSRADLFDPATNVTLGAARLSSLIEEYGGQLPVALAAYNAGPGAAERWLPSQPIDADIWIENIPFNETRAYVRRVLWHSFVYEWLDRERALSTRDFIDTVNPPDDAID